MNTTTEPPPWEALKQRTVVSNLCAGGLSQERAEELWNALDHTKSVEALIADAIFWAASDNTEAVHGTEGQSNNGEIPADVVEAWHRTSDYDAKSDAAAGNAKPDFEVPPDSSTGKAAPDTEAPPKNDQGNAEEKYTEFDPSDADDYEDDEGLDFNPSEEALQELYKAASDELNNPQTVAQNKALLAALPEWLADLIREWMRFVKIPALLPTICALVAISAMLLRGLRCWGSKGWVYPNLYAVLGAESGVGKSLIYNETARPLEELDQELQVEFKELVGALRTDLGIIESTIKVKVAAHQKALREGVKLNAAELQQFKSELTALHKEKDEIEEQMKKHPSLWSSDFTSEVLSKRLQDNNEQLSLQSDEGGIAIFNIEGRYTDGKSTDDILLSKCWTGNSHKVDRISREPISLNQPRCSLLLLVQPDILRRVFRNERLFAGGFLARTFCLDCLLKMQPELPGGQVPINAELTARWNKELRALYHKFRCASEPITVQVDEATYERARQHYNAIAIMVRHRLSDVGIFVARWREQTWRVALVLHAIRYGVDCEKHHLTATTYEAASAITRLFCLAQLKVLQALRVGSSLDTHTTLQTLFLERKHAPITLRELRRGHGLETAVVEICVKAYPEIYVLRVQKSRRGERSTILFLKAFPPPDSAPA